MLADVLILAGTFASAPWLLERHVWAMRYPRRKGKCTDEALLFFRVVQRSQVWDSARHLSWGPDKVDLCFYTSSRCGSANQPPSSRLNISLPDYQEHRSHNKGILFLSNSLRVFQARM